MPEAIVFAVVSMTRATIWADPPHVSVTYLAVLGPDVVFKTMESRSDFKQQVQ